MKSKYNYVKIIFYNVLIFIILIFLIESLLFFTRTFVFKKPSVGYLFNYSKIEFDGCQEMISHPFYGYVHNNNSDCNIRDGFSKGPFVYYNEFNKKNKSILVLGGSTTDGYFKHISDGYTWPYYLQKLINENDLNYNVINGGTGGYNSDQELLKLIIDAKNINSEIEYVISLNGINDTDNYKALPEELINKIHFFDNSLINMFNEKVYINQSISGFRFFPNIFYTIGYFKSRNFNLNTDFMISSFDSDYNASLGSENWLFNVNAMNQISKIINADYKVFLQPTMGIEGQIPLNEDSPDYKIYKEQMKIEYYNKINSHYNQLKGICSQLDFCVDISMIAAPLGNFYNDIRHHNKYGNEIIAKEIFNNIFN